jgi:hypothetical protein
LTAVAYAAMEEEFVDGTHQARKQFQALFREATSDEPTPDDGNPFGPDPARLASMAGGSGDAPFPGLEPPASAAGR